MALSSMPAAAAGPDTSRVVLKFVKAKSPTAALAVEFLADSCSACNPMRDAAFDRDNRLETLVALEVPSRRTLALRFRAPPGAVRRVILETGDVPFQTQGDVLTVPLPPVWYDAVHAGEMATHIVEPGMVLRFEHADIERRAGAYAQGTFPERQRRAADHLEFAQREVIRATGLGVQVAREGLGAIQVMGFDTNYPHGHTDAPPHVHMHLRWPDNAGTQIGHYYIDESGLLLNNQVGTKGLEMPGRNFGRGQTFTTKDLRGRPVYTHTITEEGWLTLGRAGETPCVVRPAGAGFDAGAVVACPKREPVTITVADDPHAGVLRVTTGEIVETFRYDPDTGWLLSPTAPTSVSASSYQPEPW